MEALTIYFGSLLQSRLNVKTVLSEESDLENYFIWEYTKVRDADYEGIRRSNVLSWLMGL